MIYLQLFFSFLKIGLFAIGGAYSFLPLIEKEVVIKYNWLTKQEFLDVAGIVKIFPGAISIKYATYVGNKVGGFWGAVISNIANMLSPVILIVFASAFYMKFRNIERVKNAFSMIQWVVFAMIIAAAFQVINIKGLLNPINVLIVLAAFLLFLFTKIDPVFIIIATGILGAILK
ncbi:MAG: chromate transporter [Candidatus Omnitrophota bacterium]